MMAGERMTADELYRAVNTANAEVQRAAEEHGENSIQHMEALRRRDEAIKEWRKAKEAA